MSQRNIRRPHSHARMLGGVALSVALVATGCSSDSPETAPPADDSPRALPQGSEDVDLDPAEFTTDITNPYMPLEVGDTWAYEGTDEEGALERIEVTVLDETFETALGITTRVVRDTVTVDGEVVEDTWDWYAQDQDGNVWYFGEETAEYENGEVVTTEGSWEAGVDGAEPGVVMPADPRPGLSYRQEYLAGEAEDQAVVLSADEQAEVTLGHYDDVVLTRDTNALEPDVTELKFYARGMGQILVLETSGGAAREDLVEASRARS